MFTVFAFFAGAVLGYVAHQFVSKEATTVEQWLANHDLTADGKKIVVQTIKERL